MPSYPVLIPVIIEADQKPVQVNLQYEEDTKKQPNTLAMTNTVKAGTAQHTCNDQYCKAGTAQHTCNDQYCKIVTQVYIC